MIRRTHLVLTLAAMLTLGAGAVVGRLSARLREAPRPVGHGGRGWFADELDLSADQRQHMDAIWANARQEMSKLGDQRKELDRVRDAAVKKLLSPEQQVAYDKIYADLRAGRADLDKEHDRLFREANDRSRELLTAAQLSQWEAMQKQMHDRHGGPGSRPADGGPPPPPPDRQPDNR